MATTFTSSTRIFLVLILLAQYCTSSTTFINGCKVILVTMTTAELTTSTVEGWRRRRRRRHAGYSLTFATMVHSRRKRRWSIFNRINNYGRQKSQRQPWQQINASAESTTLSSVSWHHQQQPQHSSGRRWKSRFSTHNHTLQRRAKHSFLSPPNQTLTSNDEKAIMLQLGYIPSNACRVSARSGDIIIEQKMKRNKEDFDTLASTTATHSMGEDVTTTVDISAVGFGRPIAIQCYPLLVQLMSSSSSPSYSSNDANGFDDDENGRKCTDNGTNAVDNKTDTKKNGMVITPSSTASTRTTIITPFPTLYWLTCPHVSRAISELERAGYARILRERLLSLHPGDAHPNMHDYGNKEENNKVNAVVGVEEKYTSKETSDMKWENQWRECHDDYASERWNSLSVEDQQQLLLPLRASKECGDVNDDTNDVEESTKIQSMRRILQYSGVAGTEYQHNFNDDDYTMASSSDIDRHSNSRRRSSLPSVKCLHAHYAHYRSQVSSLNNAKEGAKLEGEEMAINIVGKWTHELLLERFPEVLF